MNDEERADKRGYARGYAAGTKRRMSDFVAATKYANDMDFWDAAFLAVLPTAMVVNGWTFGDKLIISTEDRTRLSATWASHALKCRRR